MRRTRTPRRNGAGQHGTGAVTLAAVGVLAALVGWVLLAARPVATLAAVGAALVAREALRRRAAVAADEPRQTRLAAEARADPSRAQDCI